MHLNWLKFNIFIKGWSVVIQKKNVSKNLRNELWICEQLHWVTTRKRQTLFVSNLNK